MSSRERRTVRLRFTPTLLLLALAAALLALVAAGCGRDEGDEGNGGGAGATAAEEQLSGNVLIDGSSTVGPLTTAAAESYRNEQPNVNIEVGVSGTGGGFERFCAGETDISNASRPIDEEEEGPVCEQGGIQYTEVQVANDGIAIATNKDLAVDCLTTDQLKELWNKGSKVKSLADIDPSLPD